jgi:hypothetical protein
MPDGERVEAEVPPGANLRRSMVVRASADRLEEMTDGLSEGVLYGRSVVRAPQRLALAINLGQDQPSVR